jgi:hypothetical protein
MAITLSPHTQDFHETSSEIRLDTPQDVRYWTDRLEASVSQIRLAVAAVGTSAPNVEAWLRESRASGIVRQNGKWTFLQSTVRNLMFFATGLCGGVLLS